MGILYVITILALYITIMLFKKTEKKQNLIMWLAITTIIILCYNILICTILSFINILCTLLNLSICNIIVAAIISIFIIKNRKTQKYYWKISDIVVSIILLMIVIFVGYTQYDSPFNIKYKSTDGSSHYYYAEQFYKQQQLLHKSEKTPLNAIYGPEYRLPGAYVNEGILFKIFEGVITNVDLFIMFDLFVLFMSGILFYYVLQKYAKDNKKLQVISVILTVMHILGYQLSSMLYGFVYLSLALDLIITLILILSNYEKEEISSKIIVPVIGLLNFGIFFSYGYFVPIVYISIIINAVIKSIKNKEEVTSVENIIKLIIAIVIPALVGIIYFVVLPVANGKKSEISTLGRDGGVYGNYITNLVVFIPILITGLILKIKNKKKESDYGTIIFITSIVFLILLLIGKQKGIVSNYYYFKAYFIIWPLVIYNVFIALSNIFEEKNKVLKIITYVYITLYIIALIIGFIFNKDIAINNIFHKNKEYCIEGSEILEREEVELIEEIKLLNQEYYKNTFVTIPGTIGRLNWLTALYDNQYIYIGYMNSMHTTVEEWAEEMNQKYYLGLNKDYKKVFGEIELDENSDKYEIIRKNEFGFILERKNTEE